MKAQLYFWVGVLLTLPVAYLLIDRTDFAWSSRTVLSNVEEVRAKNQTCYSGKGKPRDACTVYDATLEYRVDDVTYRIKVLAGGASGHNQPLYLSHPHSGEAVRVAYDPRDPARAYRDTFWDIWGPPFAVFVTQICAFLGGFRERKSD